MNKILFLGHSHILAIRRALEDAAINVDGHDIRVICFRDREYLVNPEMTTPQNSFEEIDIAKVLREIYEFQPNVTFLSLQGNQHNVYGLLFPRDNQSNSKIDRLLKDVEQRAEKFLSAIIPELKSEIILIPPAPPVSSAADCVRHWKYLKNDSFIEPTWFRTKLWDNHVRALEKLASKYEIDILKLPEIFFTEERTLAKEYSGDEPLHANTKYGIALLKHILLSIKELPDTNIKSKFSESNTRENYYKNLSDYCFWKQAVSDIMPQNVDPVTNLPFRILPVDKVATAGSCFAQHISKCLQDSHFNFLIAEKYDGDKQDGLRRGYYDFSARYGNIYTSRQLVQLFDRAFGYFRPIDQAWERPDGRFCDPFRPRVEPGGFSSVQEVVDDTAKHLLSVRKMFCDLDVFVFTLGLTECWTSRSDGAAFPVAPSVIAGEYDADKHSFTNLGVAEIVADLSSFLDKLMVVNSTARVILTVSPVPLVATAEDRHVLVSTIYSKSVLRVAAEEITRQYANNVYYFPSYEIITGPHSRGDYFAEDRRSVTDRGVEHVMSVFMNRVAKVDNCHDSGNIDSCRIYSEAEAIANAECDEEFLAR